MKKILDDNMKQYPATTVIVILTSVVFIAMQLFYLPNGSSSQAVFTFGGMYGELVRYQPSQIWRLISPIFIHIGWEHFFLNTLSIYFLGQLGERIWGSRQFLFLYLLSGIMGNIITMVFTPTVLAAGASTSIFGLFAAVICIGRFSQNGFLKQLGQSYQALVIFNLVFNLFTPGISLAGHLGGLLGGVLCALFLPNKMASFPTKKIKLMGASAYLLLALGLIGIFLLR